MAGPSKAERALREQEKIQKIKEKYGAPGAQQNDAASDDGDVIMLDGPKGAARGRDSSSATGKKGTSARKAAAAPKGVLDPGTPLAVRTRSSARLAAASKANKVSNIPNVDFTLKNPEAEYQPRIGQESDEDHELSDDEVDAEGETDDDPMELTGDTIVVNTNSPSSTVIASTDGASDPKGKSHAAGKSRGTGKEQAGPAPTTSGLKRKSDDISKGSQDEDDSGEEDDDDDDDDDDERRKKKKGPARKLRTRNRRRKQSGGDQRCLPCIAKDVPCDWKEKNPNYDFSKAGSSVVTMKECSNCAEYRQTKPDKRLGKKEECGIGDTSWRMLADYASSIHAPNLPTDHICTNCAKKYPHERDTCDADVALGLACTSCMGNAKSQNRVKKTGASGAGEGAGEDDDEDDDEARGLINQKCGCIVNGQELYRRPLVPKGTKIWWRTRCSGCKDKRTWCDWLVRRDLKDKGPCLRCKTEDILCTNNDYMDGSWESKFGMPPDWNIRKERDRGGFEVQDDSEPKSKCQACQCVQDPHCRCLSEAPGAACSRCTYWGISCIDPRSGEERPVHNLSSVGFGGMLPFVRCTSCRVNGRNCDRQRPCDSCHNHGSDCDPLYVQKTTTASQLENEKRQACGLPPNPRVTVSQWASTKKKVVGYADNDRSINAVRVGLATKQRKNLIQRGFGQISKNPIKPPILYYLAMGYGPNGVDDVKDPNQLHSWVGPPKPVYAFDLDIDGIISKTRKVDQDKEIASRIVQWRNFMVPEGIPPHSCAGGLMRLKQSFPSELDISFLDKVIYCHWLRGKNAFPPTNHPNYNETFRKCDIETNPEAEKAVPMLTHHWKQPQPVYTSQDFDNDGRLIRAPAVAAETDQHDFIADYPHDRKQQQREAEALVPKHFYMGPRVTFATDTVGFKTALPATTNRLDISNWCQYEDNNQPTCMELVGPSHDQVCGKPATRFCKSIYHTLGHNQPQPMPLCDDCILHSQGLVEVDDTGSGINSEIAVTIDEVVRMRQYFCASHTKLLATGHTAMVFDDGSGHAGGPEKIDMSVSLRELNVAKVRSELDLWYTTQPQASDSQSRVVQDEFQKYTGCDCIKNLANSEVCKFHRLSTLGSTQEEVRRLRRVQEELFYGKVQCPLCVYEQPVVEYEEPMTFEDADPMCLFTSWLCLGCNEVSIQAKASDPLEGFRMSTTQQLLESSDPAQMSQAFDPTSYLTQQGQTPTSNTFGAAPSHGGAPAPQFGQATTSDPFGAPQNQATTTAPQFGQAPASNTFGGPQNQVTAPGPQFVQTMASNTCSATPSQATAPAPQFGHATASNPFGSPQNEATATALQFGQATISNTFSAAASQASAPAPQFGQATTSDPFGAAQHQATATAPQFGQAPAPHTFGASQNQTGFGFQQTGFQTGHQGGGWGQGTIDPRQLITTPAQNNSGQGSGFGNTTNNAMSPGQQQQGQSTFTQQLQGGNNQNQTPEANDGAQQQEQQQQQPAGTGQGDSTGDVFMTEYEVELLQNFTYFQE